MTWSLLTMKSLFRHIESSALVLPSDCHDFNIDTKENVIGAGVHRGRSFTDEHLSIDDPS